MAAKTKWKKILYEDQGVPDNYVDESFLDEMKKNLHIRTYNFWTVVEESGVVTQQICSVCIFVIVFIYMDEKILSPKVLFIVSSILTCAGYVLSEIIDKYTKHKEHKRTKLADFKTMVIFLAFSYGLSPVLMTLTDTISTDTIYAMTTCMLLTNLLFHDYGASSALVSGSVSLNAAIFASVCLASRLHTTWHAFATVTFAVEIFALWPVFRKKLKNSVSSSQVAMTILLSAITLVAMSTVSSVAAVLFFLLTLFITFVCPAWLINLQPYKDNIHGPWDEAEIKD